jgi:peptidase M23-like protein
MSPSSQFVPALAILIALSAPQASQRPALIQSVDLFVSQPPVTFNQEGRAQLVYELQVTNFLPVEISLTAVQIKSDGRTLAEYKDADLQRRIVRPGLRHDHATPHIVGPGMRAAVNLWIVLAAGTVVPSSVTHVVEMDALRPTGRARISVDGGASALSMQRAAVLDPPLRGGPWIAIYDPLLRGGHRTAIYTVEGRARIPGRLAIDFIALPPGGALVRNPAVRPDHSNGFGSDVLAVADGTVAASLDDTPDDTPSPVAPEIASGNYVAIDIGGGRFAFYEHLQRGTVAVKSGQRVRRGQVIAKLGSSGSTSIGPHLHFHVADRNSLLGAEGLPFVFREFAHLGAYASIDALIKGETPQTVPERRSVLERPAANALVRFALRLNDASLESPRSRQTVNRRVVEAQFRSR